MIVFEGAGDLLACDCQTIVCPVNTAGAMGAGLALAMRNRYAGLYSAYQKVCFNSVLSPTRLFMYPVSEERKILCLPTKRHWKHPSNKRIIELSLSTLARDWQKLGITSLGIPPIGCGLGKLDYQRDVCGLIHDYLGPLELEVSIFLGRNEVNNAKRRRRWDRNDPDSLPW